MFYDLSGMKMQNDLFFYLIIFILFLFYFVLLIKLVLLKSFLEEKNICLMKGRKTTTGSFLDSPNE